MNKKSKIMSIKRGIIGAAIAIGVIAGWYFVQVRNPQYKPLPTKPPSSYTNTNISKKDWSNLAWLNNIDKKEVKGVTFSSTRPKNNAKKAWVFDGLNCYLIDNQVFIVVNNHMKILGSMSHAFEGLPNLERVVGLDLLDFSETKDTSYMFNDCPKLEMIYWTKANFESLENANGMFQDCKSLSKLDMQDFNMENAKNIDNMYKGCKSLDILNLPILKNVTSMEGTFSEVGMSARGDTRLKGKIDTSKCKNMSYAFKNAILYDFNVPESFDTSSLEVAKGMFERATIEEIDLSKWNTRKLRDIEGMFSKISSLKKCNLKWDVPSLENASKLFFMCSNLEKIAIDWKNVNTLQNANSMFEQCFSLKSIDLSSFDNQLIGDVRAMMKECDSLEEVKGKGFKANVKDKMYEYCEKLKKPLNVQEI